MKCIFVAFTILFSGVHVQSKAQNQPERAVLLIIDGLHTEAPGRLEMPNFTALASQGTLIEKTCGIIPYHPTHGDYASLHTSSYPNPVMMTGTIFLTPDQKMLQHSFENTAFVANTTSYQSISGGYQFVIQKFDSDEFAVNQALKLLKNQDIDFMRIHLQDAGDAGHQSFAADSNQPYQYNIWHEESPYVQTVEEADRQVGRFIAELKKMGKLEGTLLVITADHGQTKTGWHPTLPEDSWLFPTVFFGPGIAQGNSLEWADQIDLVPTISHIMNVPVPNLDGGSGRILHEVIHPGQNRSASSSRIIELNRILAGYIRTEAEMLHKSKEAPYLNSQVMISEREFYGLDRILEWNNLTTIESLIEHNKRILVEMQSTLDNLKRME